MKINSFDYNDEYESVDFIDSFIKDMDEQFSGKGFNSATLGQLLKYIRNGLLQYFDEKYDKKVHFQLVLPKHSDNLIEKQTIENNDIIKVYLSYDKIENYLENRYELDDYILTIIDQIELEINSAKGDFNNYLILQMDVLCDICYGELSNIRPQVLRRALLSYEMWQKLAKKSSVFNDYYRFFNENRESNKNDFAKFIKKLVKRCEIS